VTAFGGHFPPAVRFDQLDGITEPLAQLILWRIGPEFYADARASSCYGRRALELAVDWMYRNDPARRKNPPLDRLPGPRGLVLLQGLQIVKATEEQQVGDLLDDLERIGNAAGPEGIPDAVDLIADFAGSLLV
jgi:hypothetical protein